MTSVRKFLVLAFVTTLALTSAGASTIGDGPLHDVVLIEAPPTFGSCRLPISTMSGSKIGLEGGSLTVSNKTSSGSQDALIFDLVVEGRKRMFWTPLELRPGSSASVRVEFLKEIDSSETRLCGNHPVGVVDSPQPVLEVVVVAE